MTSPPGDEQSGFNELGEVGVVRVCSSGEHVIALLRDNRVRVWNRENGHLCNIIEMVRSDGYC